MIDYESKAIFYIVFPLVGLCLLKLTNINNIIIIMIAFSIACILVLYHIFKRDGLRQLKLSIIVLSYISIPTFVLVYCGIFDYIQNPIRGPIFGFMICFLALAGLYTGYKLNLLGIDDSDIHNNY